MRSTIKPTGKPTGKSTRGRVLPVVLAAAVLVGGANITAYAATGGKFILGHTNKASKVSTLKRTTSGPALTLKTKSSENPPFTTNGLGKVANLNADQVDGMDAAALRTGTYVFTHVVPVSSPSDGVLLAINLPAGTYQVGYSAYLAGGEGPGGGFASCAVIRHVLNPSSWSIYARTDVPTQYGVSPALSGTAVVSAGPGMTLSLSCYALTPFFTEPTEPIQVYATRTTVLGGGTLAMARTAGGAGIASRLH